MCAKLSNKFRSLRDNQEEEPLICYVNKKGKRVYGTERFLKADINITNSLCIDKVRHLVVVDLESPISIKLLSGFETTGYKIKLIGDNNDVQ